MDATGVFGRNGFVNGEASGKVARHHLRFAMSARQPDLFVSETQPGLFQDRPERKYFADPDRVRAKLHRLLAEMRAAQSMPWDERTLTLHRTVFPQMTNWLPDDEAAQLRLEFETALERLKAA